MSHLEVCHLGVNINGFDRPILEKSAKKGRVVFVNFVICNVVREFGFTD